ncbi:MAG TPA: DNA polymerase II, partial [Byssovorax sp.]
MSAQGDHDAAAAAGRDRGDGDDPRAASTDFFLLTRAWRDTDDGHTRVELWGATASGVVRVIAPREEPVFFVDRGTPTSAGRRRETELKTQGGAPVDAVRFPTRRAMQDEAARLRSLARTPYESDVKPSDRFLMERFVTGSARARGRVVSRGSFDEITSPSSVRGVDAPPPRPLKVAALDIESLGPDVPLMSIAVAARDEERVWLVGPDLDERGALRELVAWITRFDPDVIAGWSVAEFDLAVLERRCERLGVPFTIGRGGDRARVLDGSPPTARVSGRVVLDGPQTLRSATYALESYRLDDVARRFVGRGKAIAKTNDPVAEILRMARDDPAALAAYNLEDCRLVLDVLDRADLLGFAIERQRLTGLPMDKAGGSVAAFDHLYLPRLHRAGYVAPDVGDGPEPEASPGGFVLESAPGAYEHVLVLDFRSLYPSIIRTWRIDPLGLWRPGQPRVAGFDGATFARGDAILPELIATLWDARSKARAEGRAAMSTAIKIVMNSFYGVLGTPGCRFFDPRLAASITRRGHEVIGRAQRFIEARGLEVIYGDTDSLFVLAGDGATEASASALGKQLADDLNAHFRDLVRREHDLESFLEIRFDTHFSRFLMPTLRHSERGTKKRYAG